MGWEETASDTFVARHDERDSDDAARVLKQLEHARARLEERFDARPGELAVVLHPSTAQLDAAQPWLPLARRLTAPAAGPYVLGSAAARAPAARAPGAPLRRRRGRGARAARALAAAARAPGVQRRGLAGDADAGAERAARAPLRR